MGLHPAMSEPMAADRMRDRRRAADRRRSDRATVPSGPAGHTPRRRRAVSVRAGQLLIAAGLRLAGDDRATLALPGQTSGQPAA